MDKIDQLLLEAWNRITAKVRRDRVEALKRSQRRFKGVLTRPMREWCLVIRASDTRINDYRAIVEASPKAEFSRNPIESHQPHFVTLSGTLIRELTKPVMIPWPGVTCREAADMLGRPYDSIFDWLRKGVFRVDRYREFKFPERRKRPYVWTPSPIDPNNFHGRTPHAMWGTLWQGLWQDLPEEYMLRVQRVPRERPQPTLDGSNRKFVGWEFVCPGRLDANRQPMGCGKRCTYLYGPQTVWTLAKALAGAGGAGGEDGCEEGCVDGCEDGFEMPENSGLAGQWFPGLTDPVAATGPRSFACKTCWGVRTAVMSDSSGWNDFITHISGGLLYGREVRRPLDICPMVRKKRRYKRKSKSLNGAVAATGEVMSA